LIAVSFKVHVEHGAWLTVRAAGPALLADLCGLFNLAAQVAARQGYRRALMDLRGVSIDLGFTEHLQLGAHAADSLRHLERVASVVDASNRTGTSEKAAQKLGLQLRTFTSLDEGLAWLQS
jgi:hypothetical protein